ncbi:MAG: acyl--CoA ligase [Burkholderiaceae bacterium]|nr:acyl--CoA ligase [Burkholderiaceae bacterium]
MERELFITHDRDGREIANVAAMIEQRALLQPDMPAMIMKEAVVSYRGIQAAVNAVAAKLVANGIRTGQMVGISMLQTPMHVFAMLALMRIGAPFVSVHPALPEERRMLAVRRYGVSAIISGRAECELDGLPFVHLHQHELRGDSATIPYAPTTLDTAVRIAQSSGTSGDPKGVMLTHADIRGRMRACSSGITSDSRALPMDFNFSVGFNYASCVLAAGAALVFITSDSTQDYIAQVQQFAVTDWLLSPAIAESIAAHIAAHIADDRPVFPSVRHLRLNGASPSPRLLETLLRKFTPHIYNGYGVTEAGLITLATPEMLRRYPGTAGPLLPTIEAEVVDEFDRPVPAGQSGSLRLRTPVMPSSYFPDNGLTTERFRDGWYYPRDLAHFDSGGLLFIEGRQDDVLNIGGVKVRFRDIEQVIETHPAVREAAVFIMIDGAGREKMGLAYIADNGARIANLDAYASEKLGPLRPSEYIAVNALPRTMTGKVQRDRLRNLYLEGSLDNFRN